MSDENIHIDISETAGKVKHFITGNVLHEETVLKVARVPYKTKNLVAPPYVAGQWRIFLTRRAGQ